MENCETTTKIPEGMREGGGMRRGGMVAGQMYMHKSSEAQQ